MSDYPYWIELSTDENPADYDSRNLLSVEVLCNDGITGGWFVLRKSKDSEYYRWFVNHKGMEFTPVNIDGDSISEAESEFELVFGLLHGEECKVKAARWYRYPNKF